MGSHMRWEVYFDPAHLISEAGEPALPDRVAVLAQKLKGAGIDLFSRAEDIRPWPLFDCTVNCTIVRVSSWCSPGWATPHVGIAIRTDSAAPFVLGQ